MNGESLSAMEKKFLDMSLKVTEETGYYLYDMEYIKGSKTLTKKAQEKVTINLLTTLKLLIGFLKILFWKCHLQVSTEN